MVTALSNGKTTIEATSANGSLISSCTITVAPASGYSRVASSQTAHDVNASYSPVLGDKKIPLVPVVLQEPQNLHGMKRIMTILSPLAKKSRIIMPMLPVVR